MQSTGKQKGKQTENIKANTKTESKEKKQIKSKQKLYSGKPRLTKIKRTKVDQMMKIKTFKSKTRTNSFGIRSKYHGVYYLKLANVTWYGKFCYQGAMHRVGSFTTEEEAARAVNAMCVRLDIPMKNEEELFDPNYMKKNNRKSKFKGLDKRVPRDGQWIAQIWLDGFLYKVGTYQTEENAARAVDEKCRELRYAPVNEKLLKDEESLLDIQDDLENISESTNQTYDKSKPDVSMKIESKQIQNQKLNEVQELDNDIEEYLPLTWEEKYFLRYFCGLDLDFLQKVEIRQWHNNWDSNNSRLYCK